MPIDTPVKNPPKKVAVIHDWLLGFRGGEHILEAILEIYPQAEVFTLFYRKGKLSPGIEKHKIHVSFLNKLPWVHLYYRHLLPLFPLAIERFDLSNFDLVISSSHCVAKGVIPSPQSMHICYSHTPMRYAWDRYRDYFGSQFLEPLILPIIHYLRMWDVTSSHRVDHFIANSQWVQSRIKKFYRREATVIPPFVHFDRFHPVSGEGGNYYLVVSAFAPYKRIDLAIGACEKLGRPLWIVGDGQEAGKLHSLAGKHTRFLGKQSHEELVDLYAGAKALLFPGEEDFGITPLEAMACGRPVIAFNRGGVLDSVVDGKTGLFFNQQTPESLCDALLRFESLDVVYSKEVCRQRAETFSRRHFIENLKMTLDTLWQTAKNGVRDSSNTNLAELNH